MPDNADSRSKENIPQGIVTPTRQRVNGLNSPAQTKSAWDSGDPMRNPPPLPLSPQMLKTAGGQSKILTPASPVGKLQFTAVDTTEIEYQLQKVVEAQNSLKSLLQGVDVSVKQTQMDLENLQQRSANNNSHLKNLLENVSTAVPTVSSALSANDLQEAISKSEKSMSEKLAAVDDLRVVITDGLAKILSTTSNNTHPELMMEIAKINEQLSSIPRESHKDLIDYISSSFQLQDENHDHVKNLVSSTQDYVTDLLKDVHTSLASLDIERHILAMRDTQGRFESEVKNQVAVLLSRDTKEDTEKVNASLSDLATQVASLKSESLKSIGTLAEKNDVSEKLTSLKTLIQEVIASEHSKLNEGLTSQMSNLESSHKTVLEKSASLEAASRDLGNTLQPPLAQIMELLQGLEASLQMTVKKVDSLKVEKKELELSAKDNEIAQLKKELEEERTKATISATILELTEQKSKLESKLEGLQNVYNTRYEDLRALSREHQELTSKWLEFNTDKLKSIGGTAVFTQMTLEEAELESPSYKKGSAVGSRVLSTNSYLTNRRSTLSPRPRKHYNLAPIEAEESEKENYQLSEESLVK